MADDSRRPGRRPPVWQGPQRKPAETRGTVTKGRISKLAVGQGHGFIRLQNGREVFFHRADVDEGTSFNGLREGDRVTFELLEDAVSGARAIHVMLLPAP